MLDYQTIRSLIWNRGILPDANKCPEDVRVAVVEINRCFDALNALYNYLDVLLDENGAPKENEWDIPQGAD